MRGRNEKIEGQKGAVFWTMGKCLLLSYLVTGVLLLVLALLLYRLEFSGGVVAAVVVGIYILSCLLGGLVAGKAVGSRKFMWGLCLGVGYFLVLAVLSLCFGSKEGIDYGGFFRTFLICGGSGMLGGMLG